MGDLPSKMQPASRPEPFTPPELTSLASLTDGRPAGAYESAYPLGVWTQIAVELIYLVSAEIISLTLLLMLAIYASRMQKTGFFFDLLGPYPASANLVAYLSIGLSGACGGCTFSLKWLYHTVAKKRWHRDRMVWRMVVPISSAFLALFSGLMIISGLVPFLARAPLTIPATGAAYGFFVGVFSDNVLAALQKLAQNIFGTVDTQKGPISETDQAPKPDGTK
jgi:D-serine dehydratase